MSAFDERDPFKKRIVTASLTAEQREEFDALKKALSIATDGGLIKRALAELSRATLGQEPSEREYALASAWGEGYAAGQDSLSGPTGEYVDDPRLRNPYTSAVSEEDHD